MDTFGVCSRNILGVYTKHSLRTTSEHSLTLMRYISWICRVHSIWSTSYSGFLLYYVLLPSDPQCCITKHFCHSNNPIRICSGIHPNCHPVFTETDVWNITECNFCRRSQSNDSQMNSSFTQNSKNCKNKVVTRRGKLFNSFFCTYSSQFLMPSNGPHNLCTDLYTVLAQGHQRNTHSDACQ